MKSICTAITFVLITISTFAQTYWQRSYGGLGDDFGRTVEVIDGGYILAGSSNSFFDPSTDIYAIRLDEEGDFVWGRNFGEPEFLEWAVSSSITPEGDIVLAGYTNNSDGNAYDGILLKINADGDLLWMKNYGLDDWDFFNGVSVNEDGHIFAAGHKTLPTGQVGWIMATDAQGEVIWEAELPCAGAMSLSSIEYCGDGKLAFSGTCFQGIDGPHDIYAGVILDSGELQWMQTYQGMNPGTNRDCNCGASADMLLIGDNIFGLDAAVFPELYRASLDLEDGTVNWIRHDFPAHETRWNAVHVGNEGKVLNAGSIIGAGFAGWDASGIEFNHEGFFSSQNSSHVFGGLGEDMAFDLKPTPDGGYITAGHSNSFGNNFQFHVMKIGPGQESDISNTDFLDVVTTVENVDERHAALRLYPNPASSHVNVSWHEGKGARAAMRLLTLEGKLLSTFQIVNGERIDLSLNQGIYMIEVSTQNWTKTARLLVLH